MIAAGRLSSTAIEWHLSMLLAIAGISCPCLCGEPDGEASRLLLGTVLARPEPVMPPRVFTPTVLAQARKRLKASGRLPFFAATQFGDPKRADRWFRLPREGWRQIISGFAPLALADCRGACPFCGKALTRVMVDLTKPLEGKTACCRATVHAESEAMPADHAARPNRELRVPHLDGTVHTYRFYVSAGAAGERKRWFCGAGELWRARMNTLLLQVVPDLSARLLSDGTDAEAAQTLAAIFDRLAEVYPGLPFYDFRGPLGFEGGWENMTADAYQRRLAEWNRSMAPYEGGRPRHFKLLETHSYGLPGKLRHCSTLAEAYDLLRHHPVAKVYSQERYGSATAFDERVMERLFRQMNAWARRVTPGTGNMQMYWFMGAIKLAVLTGDIEHLRKAAFWYESYLRNHFYSDGLSIETAFNYSAMLGFLFHERWISEELMGIDFVPQYPLLERIRELGDYPVVTLANVESMHADQHAQFFTSRTQPPPGKKLDYQAHSRSQNFPDYGLTCLRAGAPGSRLELIMDYQNAILHAHCAALNLQLFYQGVNLLPDLGYNTSNANPEAEPWKGLECPFELIKPTTFANDVEGHNTGTALGSQFGHNSVVFERFLGLPQSPLQMVQAEGKWLFETHKWPADAEIPRVSVFSRQVATLTLPNGRALALDFFRMQGGWRHDVFWHAPAAETSASLGEPERLSEPSLMEHYRQHATPKPGWMREATYLHHLLVELWKRPYFEGLRLITEPMAWQPGSRPWHILWRIDPARYAPITPSGTTSYKPWSYWLKPVNLRLWGSAEGPSAKREVIFAGKAPWAGHLEMGRYSGSSRLAFKDGLQVLVEHRQGGSPDIASTFVHVLEPNSDAQAPALRTVDVRPADGAATMGTVLELVTPEGDKAFVAGSLSGGTIRDSAIRTDARLAMAMPTLATFTLFDGSRLEAEGLRVVASPTARTELVRVIGDLTGRPQQSSLIVRSRRPLPLGDVLAGQTVSVEHQTSGAHASAYEIEEVSLLGDGLYRIGLRHHPPFIRRKLSVTHLLDPFEHEIPATPARTPGDLFIGVTHKLHDGVGRPNALGRLVLFPRTGFRTTVAKQRVGGYAGWWSNGFFPGDVPSARDVRVGDPVIVYTIGPGDTVVIPTLISCRPVEVAGEAVTCEVYATSPAELTIEGATKTLPAGMGRATIAMSRGHAVAIRQALATALAATTTALDTSAVPPPKPEIAAHYSFDDDPPKYVRDATGNNGNAWIKDGEGVTYVGGIKGKAIHLDGRALISVWKHRLVLTANTAVSFWLQIDGAVGGEQHPYAPGIFSSNAKGAFDAFVTLALAKGNTDQLTLEDAAGETARFDVAKVEPGRWRHFALSIDDKGEVTCYDGGTEAGKVALTAGPRFSLPIAVIGRGYGANAGSPLTGALDEVIFLNRALSPEEAARLARGERP